MFRILFVLFCTTTLLCPLSFAEEYADCEGKLPGSFVAVSSNCSQVIYCDGQDSSIVDCDSDNPYFSPEDETCNSDFSVCDERPFSLDTTTISTTTLSTPTIAASISTTLAGVKPTIATKATATANAQTPTIFIPITTPASTKTTTTTKAKITFVPFATRPPAKIQATTNHPNVIQECPGVDNPDRPLFLPHAKTCSQYYLCYHGVATLMQCPNMLHFDVAQQTCNTAENAKCQVNSLMVREQCLPHVVDIYPHPSNCNYYYICEYGFLMVMQCPFNMEWDYLRRICSMKSRANCYNTLRPN